MIYLGLVLEDARARVPGGLGARPARDPREADPRRRVGDPLAELVQPARRVGVPVEHRLAGADRHLPRRVPRAEGRHDRGAGGVPAAAAVDEPERRLLRVGHDARRARLEADAAARREGARGVHAGHRVLRRRTRTARDAAVVLLPDARGDPRSASGASRPSSTASSTCSTRSPAPARCSSRRAPTSTPPRRPTSSSGETPDHERFQWPVRRRAGRRHLPRARRLAPFRPPRRRCADRGRPSSGAARSRRLPASVPRRTSGPTSCSRRCTGRAARTGRCSTCSRALGVPTVGLDRCRRAARLVEAGRELARRCAPGLSVPESIVLSHEAFRELGAASVLRVVRERARGRPGRQARLGRLRAGRDDRRRHERPAPRDGRGVHLRRCRRGRATRRRHRDRGRRHRHRRRAACAARRSRSSRPPASTASRRATTRGRRRSTPRRASTTP